MNLLFFDFFFRIVVHGVLYNVFNIRRMVTFGNRAVCCHRPHDQITRSLNAFCMLIKRFFDILNYLLFLYFILLSSTLISMNGNILF